MVLVPEFEVHAGRVQLGKIQCLRSRVQDPGFSDGTGFEAHISGSRVQGPGFKDQD